MNSSVLVPQSKAHFRRHFRLLVTVLSATLRLLSPASAQELPDRVFLTTGEILNGRVTNDKLVLATAYGEISLPTGCGRSLATIESGGEQQMETFDNERLTGHLMDSALLFGIDNGVKVEIRKERIRRVVMAPRGEWPRLHRSYFQMKNGDSMYGKINDTHISMTTTYGPVDIQVASILRLQEDDGQTLVQLASGNSMRGFLATNFLSVTMNCGPTVRIPKDSIGTVILSR